MLFCFSFDGHHRTVLTAIQNEQLVNGFARTIRLNHGISAFYGKFLISHVCPFYCEFLLQFHACQTDAVFDQLQHPVDLSRQVQIAHQCFKTGSSAVICHGSVFRGGV